METYKPLTNPTPEEIRTKIASILRRHDVVYAAAFGSTVRGDARPDSDLDLLIDFGPVRKTLFDLAALKEEMEAALERPVDLVTLRSLDPLIRSRVLNEQIPIL